MGFFSDTLAFDKFWLKDIWKGIEDDPKRLVLGVDPVSTEAWNAVLGRDDRAIVNAFGGPREGTYERAEAAGVPTESGRTAHGVAQTIAGAYGAAGLGGAAGNVFGGGAQGAQPGLWNQAFSGTTGLGGAPYGSAPAAGIGGIAGPVGGGTGAGASAGLGGMDYAKLGMQAMGQMQPQQQPQQPPPQAPVRNMAQPNQVPTYGQRIASGLGRVGQALFPVDPNTGMTPDQMKALQTSGMMQMGLGMLGASGRGAGFGESLAKGYGLAQGNHQGTMQQTYENAMKSRAETRAVDREKRLDEQQDWMREHQEQRDLITDSRSLAEFDYRGQQDKAAQDRWEAEQKATADWRRKQLENRGLAQPPSGYRWNPETGGLQYIPGGPADPKVGERVVKPTEYDKKAKLLYNEMVDAEGQYRQATGADTSSAWNAALNSNPVSRIFTSEDYRKHEASGMRWAQNFLYLKSGASAPAEEVRKAFVQYLPQPGDGDEVIDQKRVAREQAMDSVAEANSLPLADFKTRKNVGGRNYVQVNGQWFEDDGA
jgi:Ni/Co efflux regulator RcnB